MRFWVFAANPRLYRAQDAVTAMDEDWWMTKGSPVRAGDRAAIWKYKGNETERGIIALGEVLTDPQERDTSDTPFWTEAGQTQLAGPSPRVLVHYVRPPGLPLWLEQDGDSVVNELSVSRAQGGTCFVVSASDWDRLVEEGGGWPGDGDPRRFWWVNQNQTHREEIAGGFMWSPKKNVNGARNQFYENMREVSPGDIVFSYYRRLVQQVGVATTRAETMPKPEFGPAGQSNNWSEEGWLVGVEYTPLDAPFRPKDHLDLVRPLLPNKYSPLQQDGDGSQSAYLAEITEELARVLVDLAGAGFPDPPIATDSGPPDAVIEQESQELANLQGRSDIGDVERAQLVLARRGQGLFRRNVRMNESKCRVTGVRDPAHLRASHIKPWRDSTDTEKVHGCNGLLLAPHVDHLFDRGWISFSNDGELMIAAGMPPDLLEAWGISSDVNVGSFSETQAEFLEYHRNHVFLD